MSDGRSAMRMTDDEVAAFLDEGRRVHVATHGPGQAMHLVPLSYVMIDGRLTLWTDGDSQKVANLRRDPRVAVCQVDRGRWSTLEGTAEVLEDADSVADAVRRYAERYRQPRENPERVAVRITITRVIGNL
jgi:PPOX class probable F420-dependent enzyme